ncbi:hypothetical protein GCM10022247_34710 [Allokutzneria multivorans]|uniref:Uncharacterized protein n=1 Tax=Allokutzneria multivorans TaxID=1142134 RepID=A0ABP7SC95_9PSEU
MRVEATLDHRAPIRGSDFRASSVVQWQAACPLFQQGSRILKACARRIQGPPRPARAVATLAVRFREDAESDGREPLSATLVEKGAITIAVNAWCAPAFTAEEGYSCQGSR